MDADLLTGAIFVDFRKAFDTIDHKSCLINCNCLEFVIMSIVGCLIT